MRLSSALVERTLTQYDGQAIPDDHPVVPQLKGLFGDHTFFLDGNGLHIVEPVDPAQPGAQSGRVVEVATWKDADRTRLSPHEPEPTDTVVVLWSDA